MKPSNKPFNCIVLSKGLIMKYQVLVHKNGNIQKAIESLELDVSKAIEHGWMPQGGVSCFAETKTMSNWTMPDFIVSQAIIKA